jgi:glycerol-3-phosphate dehydrogenase
VTAVQQGPEENPLTFLQHLKDAIRKHTTVDPESQVGEVLLKDKFLTQSAPDICRKLQMSVAEGEKSLDQLIQLAMSVYDNWDVIKKKEKDKRHHDFIAALRECPT